MSQGDLVRKWCSECYQTFDYLAAEQGVMCPICGFETLEDPDSEDEKLLSCPDGKEGRMSEETKTVTHTCGWAGYVEDIWWNWSKSDMSDFGGYCPGCGKEWHDGREYPTSNVPLKAKKESEPTDITD